MPTFGSLFSGVGGFDRGLELAGWTCAFQCEIDPFCQRVLARHWPYVARWADVRERQGDGNESPDLGTAENAHAPRIEQPERIDLLCGGFPCQDLSVAGKRAGLGGERSGLFWEFLRVADQLQPRWLLLENVPGLLSSRGGRDFGALLEGLENSGYGWAYRILDSQHFGVAQRRRRVFIIGHRGGPCPPAVLFEPEGRPRHPAPSREAGARVAASLTSGTHGAGVSAPGRRKEDDVNLIARPVVGTSYKGHDDDTDTLLVTGPLGGGNDGIGRRTTVRRLTPTECERLQGFPDGWTCLCGVEPYSTMACRCPDSARYRAMGNAVTVPVIVWLGRRLLNETS
jgi:DNA (cytosine-5)-methyltransferase 1